ncbi:hypothetical protein, partial [Phenylobacterium sp.]|uniref:hypothetical protein n=1 Tax=Phenylobacterium sp. TaxID=1871053 RepID=UPI00286A0432
MAFAAVVVAQHRRRLFLADDQRGGLGLDNRQGVAFRTIAITVETLAAGAVVLRGAVFARTF